MFVRKCIPVALMLLFAAAPQAMSQDFKRGDANGDGCTDVLDCIFLFSFLNLAGSQPPCLDAADVDDDGQIGLADALTVAEFILFPGTPPPPPPGPDVCGPDPTADALGCAVYDSCAEDCTDECKAEDNGSGTIDLPPPCNYFTSQQPFMIIDGLPPGTTINVHVIHGGFTQIVVTPGGVFPGGQIQQFDCAIQLDLEGTGVLAGFSANVFLTGPVEIHSGPTQLGEPVQTFPTEMRALLADALLPGPLLPDALFELFELVAGADFGLPSPGQTTLVEVTPVAGPVEYLVDSQFDVNYEITFIGAQGGPLEGMAGSTEGISSLGTLVPQVGVPFIRGDSDGNGMFQGLIDSLFALNFGFVPGSPAPPCLTTADADGNDSFNPLVDGLFMLNFGFVPGAPPIPPPFPNCGGDASASPVGCDMSPLCP